MEARLHPYLRALVAGRIEVDVERSSAEEVLAAAGPVIADTEHGAEREALERLERELGTGGRAAAGLDDVLGQLDARRVETLLLERGFRASGVLCPACGWLGPSGERCPVDDKPTQSQGDIIDPAVQAALTQSAQVLFVDRDAGLARRGSVAALLRY